ncbi:DNA ligase [uncultured Desulfosarcina sp.]|uniref:DNA ligase n=1 Tax=uncultured Desulfosarcina sp. TaxID=218289 RepID=UPI0029C6731C|nr:DNA ligase [uncultured Desulfosarcina sp.]
MITRFVRTAIAALALIGCFPVLLSAGPPLLQHPGTYTGNQDVVGWLMSEKLDGIRGYWDGKQLLTRQGRVIHAPGWFTENFPPFALDGELWRKRNDFAFVQKTVLDAVPSKNWREITYNIFEVPGAGGDFPTRLDKAGRWFDVHPAIHVRIIEQIRCQGTDHLDAFLKNIESMGGEGIVIKDPSLPFQAGRNAHVLKVKNFSDMEGTVIAHNPGKGQFEGMLGSLTLRLENGIQFKLGTGFTMSQRKAPPPIGALVTFKYYGFTRNGVPRFASFMRVRRD